MALTTKARIIEMMHHSEADASVRDQYNKIEREYKKSKQKYKTNRAEYEEEKEKLDAAYLRMRETPYLKRGKIKRRIRMLKRSVETKRQRYRAAKEEFKSRLKEFRELKRTIREQSRICKLYKTFFKRFQEANRMGIEVPRYIQEEVARQTQIYRESMFSISREGKMYIPQPDTQCSRDLASLILEARAKVAQENAQKAIEKAKEILQPKETNDEGR